jgi:hypothetical protein
MQAEVDQSGKVEGTQKSTVLALAGDKISYSIRISARAKRAIIAELMRIKPDRSRRMQTMLTFATLLYLLLRDNLRYVTGATIDTEYSGHSPTIKEHILNLFQRHGAAISPEILSFHQIGKKSPAHHLAISVFRGQVEPTREIGVAEVLAEFGK